jgi:hypothetical protein
MEPENGVNFLRQPVGGSCIGSKPGTLCAEVTLRIRSPRRLARLSLPLLRSAREPIGRMRFPLDIGRRRFSIGVVKIGAAL